MIPQSGSYRISTKLSLPKGAELWTFGDLAIKGAGKTYAACVLAEEFLKAGIPIVAIDALGIWWGLRVGINGHNGLEVVVFGGKHKDLDIPVKVNKGVSVIDEDRLRLMVRAILESRMSSVIDTSEFSKGMRRRIVGIFTSELYNLNQKYGPRHVFLEEADEWIPQRLHGKDEWASMCFGAVDDLVRKGGNFNLGCTLITQRSAVLSKDVLTQVNCLIVLRTLHKLDKLAVQTWVESVANPDDKRIAKWYDSLKDLKNGEAWIWHPEDPELFDRIKFRERETLHATREYFTRSEFEQKDISMMDVGAFVSKFKKVFEPQPVQKKLETLPMAKEAPRLHPPMPISVPLVPPVTVVKTEPIPQQQINTEGAIEIDLEEKRLVIRLTHSEKLVNITTETQKGQVLYILANDFKDTPASSGQILSQMAEHGWVMSSNSFSPSVAKWVDEGLILREGTTRDVRYRLPRFVVFDVRKSESITA